MTKSERIKIKRQLQDSYEKYTHPKEKTEQIKSVLEDREGDRKCSNYKINP